MGRQRCLKTHRRFDRLTAVGVVGTTLQRSDIVIALLGVSAGLAGLILVFLGLVVTAYQSFAGDTPERILGRYRRATGVILVAFGLGIACVLSAFLWLVEFGERPSLYTTTLWLFGSQIAALVCATGWTVARVVWGK
jgi:uncharacterized membrane protein